MEGNRYPENLSPIRGDLPEIDTRFAELREDFLLAHTFNTARAYWGDLEHVRDWLADYDRSFFRLTDSLLFRYLCTLVSAGYSEGTIRRRTTCLRAFAAHAIARGVEFPINVDVVAARLRERRPDQGMTSVLIVSDDVIVREGLAAAAVSAGIVDHAVLGMPKLAEQASELPPYDYAVVHMWPREEGLDRLPGMDAVSLITQGNLASTVIVLASFKPKRVVALRLAEAGCDFVFPYAQVRTEPQALFVALRAGEPDGRFALATQWAIREELGLRWNGEVAPFLVVAQSLPAPVWLTNRPQTAFKIERAQFREVQLAARDVAGLPEPHFSRYASSLRRPPELPEWQRVRRFVRELWALPAL